ncbi:MAG: aldehyde dehydrogenase [Myxococcota bacterium]
MTYAYETRGQWIGGAWVPSRGGGSEDVVSPATGAVIGKLITGTTRDVDDAVESATSAAAVLATMTPFERAKLCFKIAESIEKRKEALAKLLSLEQGKPLHSEAYAEVGEAAECFRLWGEEAKRIQGAVHTSADANKRILTIRQPRGVYAVITPWNWPLTMPAELLAPALAAGNSVVWVPAPTTSLTAALLAECIAEAELPKGAVNLVMGHGPVVGDAVAAHPGTRGIAFIGSTVTGEKVAARGAGKALLLELGGNGPFVVCHDADLDRAAQGAAIGAFLCAGQSCAAAGRILVDARVAKPFCEKLVAEVQRIKLGDPADPATTMGPVNNTATADKTERHVNDAVAKGAKLVTGGKRKPGMPTPLYFEPTILENVTPNMQVFSEETFGPVAPITTFTTEEELIALADLGHHGLVAAVYTRDLARSVRLAERIRCGVVNVNESTNYWELHVPYGGVRRSGIGRIGGQRSLDEMSEVKTIILDVRGNS